MSNTSNPNNKQKAALLLLSLEADTVKRVFANLSQSEIEELTLEITNLREVPATVVDTVLSEFQSLITAQEYLIQGGADQAQAILEKSLGAHKAMDILDRVKTLSRLSGFESLKRADSRQLASFLQKEHPQTIALILSNLKTEQSAQVLAELDNDLRDDVSFRMATLGKVSPALLMEMEGVLEGIAQDEISEGMSSIGGTKAVASILNKVNTASAKSILEHIDKREHELAIEIKRLMFLFEDLINLDDKGIQRMLREIDKKDLALSLKVADEDLKKKIFTNMSERARELLKEELQYMGPVRLRDVESAQTRVVMVVKNLEDQGEIVIAGRGGGEDVLV